MARLIWLIGLGTLVLGLMYGAIAAFVPWLLPLILGEAYSGAVLTVQIALAGLALAGAASLLGALLQGVGLKHFVATAAVAMSLSCLLAVGVGAWFFGATGAAVGLCLSFVVQTGLLLTRLLLFTIRREPNR